MVRQIRENRWIVEDRKKALLNDKYMIKKQINVKVPTTKWKWNDKLLKTIA